MGTRYTTLLDAIDRFANSGQGYDQGQRWSWLDKNTKTIIPGREADCSASVGGLFYLAGYLTRGDVDGTLYTGNIVDVCRARGFRTIDVRGWDFHRIDAAMRPGYALNGAGHVVIKRRGGYYVSCNGDEFGRASGGQAGNQSGQEVTTRPLWARGGSWQTIIIPPDTDTAATPAPAPSGSGVRALQAELNRVFPSYIKLVVDGIAGPATASAVKEFQRRYGHGLVQDGIAGPKTLAALRACGCKL